MAYVTLNVLWTPPTFSAREAEKASLGWQNLRKQNEDNPALLNTTKLIEPFQHESTFMECMKVEEFKTGPYQKCGMLFISFSMT